MRDDAFWDASTLVPLCIHEVLTPDVRRLRNRFDITAWWATPVEIASAAARYHHSNTIDPLEFSVAMKLAGTLEEEMSLVMPSESIRNRAKVLLTTYQLRAPDALQLAAALDWCDERASNQVFLTADTRLREAARLAGFNTTCL